MIAFNTSSSPSPSKLINLFVQYYKDESSDIRQQELDFCLITNVLHSKNIDFVYVIKSKDTILPGALHECKNVKIILCEERPTFGQIMKWIADYTTNDDINILSNSDICFSDSSISKLRQLRKTEALCLSRWNVTVGVNLLTWENLTTKSRLHHMPRESADSWIIRGHYPPKCIEVANFQLGKFGCDNRFAKILQSEGQYKLINPCQNIKTYHVHHSKVRHYKRGNAADVVKGPIALVSSSKWVR